MIASKPDAIHGAERSRQHPIHPTYFKRQVGLEMGCDFRIRLVSGPEIANFGSLNDPTPLRNPSKMVGRFAPSILDGFRSGLGPLRSPKSAVSGPETGRI